MNMKNLALLVAALTLSACVNIPKQAFNKEAAQKIQNITVVQLDNEDAYEAAVLGHPGMSFGLIGGLVAAADMQSKSNKLTSAVDPKVTRLRQNMSERLTSQLNKIGYQTKTVVLAKSSTFDAAVSSAKQYSNDADALLVVNISGKYLAAGPTTDYIPYINAKVKAVDTRSGASLYEDTITYGYTLGAAKTIHLASDPSHKFKNIDELTAEPAKTREYWYSGLDAVSAQIASDLQKN